MTTKTAWTRASLLLSLPIGAAMACSSTGSGGAAGGAPASAVVGAQGAR